MEFIDLHSIVYKHTETQLIVFCMFNLKIGLLFLQLSFVELKLSLKYTQFAILGNKVPILKR